MSRKADVCMVLEGTYPYVEGGVSSWTHELINRQSHLTFHLVCLLPKDADFERKYKLPDNVVSVTDIHLQDLPMSTANISSRVHELKAPLNNFTIGNASTEDLEKIVNVLHSGIGKPGVNQLLDSEEAWGVLVEMNQEAFEDSSFLDYFWSWRAIAGGLYSIMLADIPDADVYHALSTGYAGVFAARAKLEKNRPVLLTEHGIYTNERRIEIASAEWIEEAIQRALTVDETRSSLRDFWIDSFTNYSRVCYEAADEIITLYSGNQIAQLADGADENKMVVIPNGVDVERFSALERRPSSKPTIALIGRVVPIKDIKSFIRTCGQLSKQIPDLKAYIMGSHDEDEEYYEECKDMVEYMTLNDVVEFTGQVKIDDYLPEVDVIVMTSISEAQPLVILEAGAAGIPCVATNVGACAEMILGHAGEEPALGEGGAIVPLSNPLATANALFELLTNNVKYDACSDAIRKRVSTHYTKEMQHGAYRDLYDNYVKMGAAQRDAA